MSTPSTDSQRRRDHQCQFGRWTQLQGAYESPQYPKGQSRLVGKTANEERVTIVSEACASTYAPRRGFGRLGDTT